MMGRGEDMDYEDILYEVADHVRRAGLEQRLRGELTELGRPVVDLPFVPEGMDTDGLYELADVLRKAGVRAP